MKPAEQREDALSAQTYLLSHLLIQSEAGQNGQRENHHRQAVVSQEVDQCSVERLHVILHKG